MINFNSFGKPSDAAVEQALKTLRAGFGLAAGYRASQLPGEQGAEDVYVVGNSKVKLAFAGFYAECCRILGKFPNSSQDWSEFPSFPGRTFWDRLKWLFGLRK